MGKTNREKLEEIISILENKESFIPALHILRGVYLIQKCSELKAYEKLQYKIMLSDFYDEYYGEGRF